MFDAGPYIDVIKALLDPSPIYAAMSYFSGLSFVVLFLFPLFAAIRLASESSRIGMKSALGEAFTDLASTPVKFMLYSIFGFVIFQMLFHIQAMFENLGSSDSIERSLAEFRERMLASREQKEDVVMTVLKFASDIGNGLTVPIFYIIYEVVSSLYIFIKHLMKVIFALLVVMTYAYGFVAIVTQALPKQLQLTGGFLKSLLALGVWVVLEPIALGLVNLLQEPGQKVLINIYGGGLGSTAMNVWCLYCSMMLTISALLLLVIPFVASKLAQNEGMVGPMAAGAGALSALMANAMLNAGIEQAKERGGNLVGNMMPDSEGTRRRDSAYQSAADRVSTVFNSDLVTGARNLVGNVLGDTTIDSGGSVSSSSPGSAGSGPSAPGPGLGATQNGPAPAFGETQMGDISSPGTVSNGQPDHLAAQGVSTGDITAANQTQVASELYDSATHDYSSPLGDSQDVGGQSDPSAADVPDGQSVGGKDRDWAKPILDMLDEPNGAPATTEGTPPEVRGTAQIEEAPKPKSPSVSGLGDLRDSLDKQDGHGDRNT